MTRTQTEIDALVEAAIATIGDPRVCALVQRLRVPARCELRPWDYGSPGEVHACWIILEDPESNTAIAYSDDGFGPKLPWPRWTVKTGH